MKKRTKFRRFKAGGEFPNISGKIYPLLSVVIS